MIHLFRKGLHLTLLFLWYFCTSGFAQSPKIIKVSDYGITSNSFSDAAIGIQEAFKEAQKHDASIIRFPGGRIDIWPEKTIKRELFISNTTESDPTPKIKNIGLFLDNLKNVTIEGNNTLIICHGKMVTTAINHCQNITIKNLSFDFERPSMSEMEIISVSPQTVEVKVQHNSTYAICDEKLTWYGEGWKSNHNHAIRYSPDNQTMHYFSWKSLASSKVIEVEPFHLRFEGDFSKTELRKGDILTTRDPYREAVGVFNNQSQNITLENINMHYMHGLGILSQFSKNITLREVHVEPRRGSGRIIAAFADCFQFSGCYGKVLVENCKTSGSHDDPINVHGTHLRIIGHNGNQFKVRFMHHQTWGFNAFEKGDTVGFVDNNSLKVYAQAIVKEAKLSSPKEMELILDRPAPSDLKEKHCLENISKYPEVVVRNSYFEHTNTRGILITSRKKVLIENNTFFRTGKHAIFIANDCNYWYESGPVRNITIRGNKFIECGYNSSPGSYVIAIKPEIIDTKAKNYVHENIKIEGNEFVVADTPLLFARSTNGLTFKDNHITYSPKEFFPLHKNPSFHLIHCKKVNIKGNHFSESFPEKTIKMKDMNKREIKKTKEIKFIQ